VLRSNKSQPEHKFLYWEFHEEGGKQAVRMGRWKGVRLKVFSNSNAPILLYDLETDLKETNDIAAKNPAIANEIKAIMQQSHVENDVFPFKASTVRN
jgi:arylsulfatase A-like enzyme